MMTTQPRAFATAGRPEIRAAWILHLAVLGVLLVLLGVLYRQAIAAAVDVWWVSPTYSHCFLIIPISAYLVWTKRERLKGQTPAIYRKALLLALPLILLSLAGSLTSINEAQQLAFIGFVQMLILTVLGLDVYRTILFPSLFLFFLVPMGEYLIGPLQTFTTHFIDAGLNLLSIPHYIEGNLIQLDNGQYEVAEACAGLRFLIATIAVGVLFVYFSFRKWHKIALYLLASAVVPVIANGFRALAIILLAHYSDNKIAVGFDHLVYGWGFSVVILFILMLIGLRFADPIPADDAVAVAVPAPQPWHYFVLTAIGAALAISVVPAILYWHDNRPTKFDPTAFSAPYMLTGWSVERVEGQWEPLYSAPDVKLAFGMRSTGAYAPAVDVFVNYYATGRESSSLIASTNKLWEEELWHPVSERNVDGAVGNSAARFDEFVISSPAETRMIWRTYWAGDRFTNSAVRVKLARLQGALINRDGVALLVLSTRIESDADGARARLRSAAAALSDVQHRLDIASKPRSMQ